MALHLVLIPLDPPPPPAKIPGSTHGFALGASNHGSIAFMESVIYLYGVRYIPIKGLWASSARMRPLTCHLSHHFAYMKCHSLAYKRLSCCLVGKGEAEGRGGYALQS